MNYIKQLNEFYPTLDYKPLNAEAIAIYFCLLQIANKTGWIDQFRVANNVLMSKCNIDKQKLTRAREKLISQGYIKYIKGKNQLEAPIYSIVQLYSDTPLNTPDNTADDTPLNTPDDTAGNTADDTINKQNKTKEYIEHFELIWERYPNKQGKAKALEYYLAWIKGRKISTITRKLTDKQMYYAVIRYAKECEENKIEQQFIKHGDTFFNKAILDYVEEERE
ncbi:MAG: hypothetical protein HFJ55_02230 [Clostridia bacterium]|jgi:hypothetical protein|nr:hypothetical protein [Clostridia bacterium]